MWELRGREIPPTSCYAFLKSKPESPVLIRARRDGAGEAGAELVLSETEGRRRVWLRPSDPGVASFFPAWIANISVILYSH